MFRKEAKQIFIAKEKGMQKVMQCLEAKTFFSYLRNKQNNPLCTIVLFVVMECWSENCIIKIDDDRRRKCHLWQHKQITWAAAAICIHLSLNNDIFILCGLDCC